MAGKIFISYRRDDAAGDARGIRDALAAKFGKANVFMDVDDLLPGQRFDKKLAIALDACDVLIAVIGSHWMDLLSNRITTGAGDYVREEIAAALKRGIVVIPVRVGQEGRMPALPQRDDLPEDIRDLVLHQKHDVAHERFGRDLAELIAAIRMALRSERSALRYWWVAAAVAAALPVIVWIGLHQIGMPAWTPWTSEVDADAAANARAASEAKRKADAEAKRAAEAAAAKKKADDEARAKAQSDLEARRQAEEAQRLRLAKAEDDRQRAAAEAKRKADEEAARRPFRAGDTFRDCSVCPEMVVVPPGEFMMGSNDGVADERPVRKVTIKAAFAVGRIASMEPSHHHTRGNTCLV
jgi:hypothetical protein